MFLNNVDYLVGPTAPMTAFKLGQNTADPLKMYLADIMTVAANLVGIPAISVPAGISDRYARWFAVYGTTAYR